MQLENCRYIVVEGPAGAGKTELARKLAEHLHATPLLEKPETNPFLAKFYRDPPRYALPTQLTFLLQRAEQIAQLVQGDLFGSPTVADYMLDKELLFAELTLSDEELRLYKSLYSLYSPKVPRPDLVIYLQAPVQHLQQKLQTRANPYGQDIGEGYLKQLSESYSRFFYAYEQSPLLIVNSAKLDFVDSAEDFEVLLHCLRQMRGGREFLNRG
ncbi:MAG: deoxynucleoside kinase [Chitinivorax sp.]